MKRHHVIISGTGRTGTTFLVQLLTKLGLDTGFGDINSHVIAACNAGMERSLTESDAPYIIKNPDLCDKLEEDLKTGKYKIDHAFIPIRDLFSAAQSRIRVSRETSKNAVPDGLPRIPGGLWHTKKPSKQEDVLARQLYKLIYALVVYDIPFSFLEFPRFAKDSAYTYQKLKPVIAAIDYENFRKVFEEVAKPGLIKRFESPNANKHASQTDKLIKSITGQWHRWTNK